MYQRPLSHVNQLASFSAHKWSISSAVFPTTSLKLPKTSKHKKRAFMSEDRNEGPETAVSEYQRRKEGL